MNVTDLLSGLFPGGHAVREEGGLLLGVGRTPGGEVAVIGVTGGTEVGVEHALLLAREVLGVVRAHPARPLLVLLDSRGQRMSRRDEILGLNGYLAHLASCLELARQRGHRVLALLTGEAASGSALALGFVADEVHALPDAKPWVMSLPAMSRVTKIPLARLEELSRDSAVLAPGLEPFLRIGAVSSVWRPPLSAPLAAALGHRPGPDRRASLGRERGGRPLAARVVDLVSGVTSSES
jgi:malonate decarboxylase gamma subunit